MASQAVPLGMNAKLYINTTNTFVVPANFAPSNTVVVVNNVRDLTLNLESAEADVTTRGNGGWGADVATIKRASVEFEMIADPEDTYYEQIREAWLAGTPTQFGIMSGTMTTPADRTEGLIAVCSVMNVSRSEALEDAQKATVTIKPTYCDTNYAPAWKEVAGV